jgi:NADH:ubiquinone oxidoreductase subunit K
MSARRSRHGSDWWQVAVPLLIALLAAGAFVFVGRSDFSGDGLAEGLALIGSLAVCLAAGGYAVGIAILLWIARDRPAKETAKSSDA